MQRRAHGLAEHGVRESERYGLAVEVYQDLAVKRRGIKLLSTVVRGSRRSSGQELQLPSLGIPKS